MRGGLAVVEDKELGAEARQHQLAHAHAGLQTPRRHLLAPLAREGVGGLQVDVDARAQLHVYERVLAQALRPRMGWTMMGRPRA